MKKETISRNLNNFKFLIGDMFDSFDQDANHYIVF